MQLPEGTVSILNLEEILRKMLKNASRNILFLLETWGSRQFLCSSHFQKVLGVGPPAAIPSDQGQDRRMVESSMESTHRLIHVGNSKLQTCAFLEETLICNSTNPATAFLRLVFFTLKSMSWTENQGEMDFRSQLCATQVILDVREEVLSGMWTLSLLTTNPLAFWSTLSYTLICWSQCMNNLLSSQIS